MPIHHHKVPIGRAYYTFSFGPLCGARLPEHSGWVRLGRFGFRWRDSRHTGPLFSERFGYTPIFKIGPYVFSPLR